MPLGEEEERMGVGGITKGVRGGLGSLFELVEALGFIVIFWLLSLLLLLLTFLLSGTGCKLKLLVCS